MYCRNCGKEILKTDKFCVNCGNATEISANIVVETNTTITNTIQNNNLPMNWWKFWEYFRFPVGFILTVFNIVDYLPDLEVNTITVFAFLIDIFVAIFMFVTYYQFLMRKKLAYNFFNTWLIIELTCNTINVTSNSISNYNTATLMDFAASFVFSLFVFGLVWTLPNYIYFKKRKNFFYEEEKSKTTQTEYKTVEELTRNV